MTQVTLLDNDYITLYYHEDKQLVHHVYKNGIYGEFLYEGLNVGTEKLIETGAYKWLSDNRAIDGVTDDESAWINEDWLPRTIAAGWKYWALVVPETAMAQMNMVQFIESFSQQGVTVRVFPDDAQAMEWITSVDEGLASTETEAPEAEEEAAE